MPVDNRTTPHQIDRTLTITNQSSCILCDLTITSLVFSGANPGDFSVVGAPATPFTIGAGNHIELTVRFNPPLGGARSATLTINSDDPANPSQAVSLSGEGLLPAITAAPATMIFGPTVYDPNCGIFCGSTQTETFTNTGQAELIADLVGFTGSPAFSGPGASIPPDRFAQGTSLSEPVTFRPTAPARKVTGTLTLRDNLPFDGVPVGSLTVERQVPLCGEAVGRGIRVLVEDNAGNPVTTPIDIQLRSVGTSPNVIINVKNLPLQTISPPTSCQTIRFQYENQKLPATEQDHPSSSYYTLNASAGGNRQVDDHLRARAEPVPRDRDGGRHDPADDPRPGDDQHHDLEPQGPDRLLPHPREGQPRRQGRGALRSAVGQLLPTSAARESPAGPTTGPATGRSSASRSW